ncbi:MAG TPA: hypothetical protein VGB55_03585 [Tepidisphaeraceae bacterium]|jgi:hypothetical protein
MKRTFFILFLIAISAAFSSAQAAEKGVKIVKQPVKLIQRSFDPKNPPKDMPKLTPPEIALCEGRFEIRTSVRGMSSPPENEYSKLTVTAVEAELKLTVTIWLPHKANKTIIEHENGHREINEHFYNQADRIAREVATPYIGQEMEIRGRDMDKAMTEAFRKINSEILTKYNARMPTEAAQSRFDAITDHGRKPIPVPEAVKQALAETKKE